MGLCKARVGKAVATGCFALGLGVIAATPALAQSNGGGSYPIATTTTVAPTTTTTTTPRVGVVTVPAPTTTVPATTTTAPTTTTTLKPAIAFTSAPPVSHGLAFTGADVAITMGVGAAALGAGGLIVLASRRRRQEP